ncbi:hypothetical protein ES703_56787 [subsurface metagenome]|uniref:DZANK-type domain-containing protein n=1 Tax=marine sediment metagenome TaxID=412755 RepID=X1B846_9ZZZZ
MSKNNISNDIKNKTNKCPYCDIKLNDTKLPFCSYCKIKISYCKKCGHAVSNNLKVCPNCGEKLGEDG